MKTLNKNEFTAYFSRSKTKCNDCHKRIEGGELVVAMRLLWKRIKV